jgi:hypothetical protein
VVSLGYGASGARVRKKVMGRTKTEVREKLKELHAQVESGVRPRRHFAVNDALDDWLETGLDGLAPATVTVYRGTIAKALREELGTVKLTSLTAGAVQKALAGQAAEGAAGRAAVEVADPGAGRFFDGGGPGDATGGVRRLVAAGVAADGGGAGAAVESRGGPGFRGIEGGARPHAYALPCKP